MKSGSSSKTTSHVNLCSDEEKEVSEKKEEEHSEGEQTIQQMMKKVKTYSRKGKKTVVSSSSKEKSPSLEDDEEIEKKDEENVEEEVLEASSKKRGKGKDITMIASVLKAQNAEKMTLRPISRAKYFDFKSLKTKGWNLKEFTNPQSWSSFVSTQCQTFSSLEREFYTNMTVKELNEEKFLESTIKGVRIQVSQNFLSDVLNTPNEGNELYNSWFYSIGVTREQLLIEYIKPNHELNSTNLKDTPKILHNMIRHTLLPRCGSFKVITDTDLCIIHHLMTKTKLNLCFVMLQHMIDQCFSMKQKVVGLPYEMHLTPIFEAVGISLDKEKGQETFMKFTAKTISQLHITTTNMPIPQKTGSMKRLANQKVQEVRKKQKADKPIKKDIGSGSHKIVRSRLTHIG